MIIIQENKNEYENEYEYEYEEDFNFKENFQLNEMSIHAISGDSDNLPFDISVKSIETNKKIFHAHIFKKGMKNVELGTFVITKNPPKETRDLVDYIVKGKHEGLKNISEEDRRLIVKWSAKRNFLFPGSNWETLNYHYIKAIRGCY